MHCFLVSQYILTNTTIVQYISVGPLSYLPDHKPLMLKIICSLHSESNETCLNINKVFDRPEMIIWNEN